jgi:hypothetical protein
MSFIEYAVLCILVTLIMCFLLGNWNLLCNLIDETKEEIIQRVKGLSIGEFILLPFAFPAIIIYLVWALLKYRPFSKES